MDIGHVTFGPTKTPEEVAQWQRAQMSVQSTSVQSDVRACNCIGPQAGERLCPCALEAEMNKAYAMLRDGVIIAGQKYRLVPV